MNPHRSNLLPSLMVLAGASVWGLFWIPLRHAGELGVRGTWPVLAAFLWPMLAMLPVVVLQWRRLAPHLGYCLVFGVFSGAGFALYALGLVHSGVVRVTLLFYLTPVWSALTAWLMLRERTRWQGWAAAGSGLAGLALILGPGGDAGAPVNVGDAYALASGVLWAFGVVTLRRHPDLPVAGTLAGQYLFATATVIAASLLTPGGDRPDIGTWLHASAPLAWFSTLVLLPGLYGVFRAAGRLPPVRVGVLMMSEVLVAAVTATLWADEYMSAIQWLGAALILAAALLETMGGNGPNTRRIRDDS